MELLLNLLWAAISVCAGVWWWNTSGRYLDGRERRVRALALGLILLLLFPVISLTDDFQSAVALSEAEHGMHSQTPPSPWDAAAVLPVLLAALCAVALTALRPQPRAAQTPGRLLRGYLRVLASRPPPAFALRFA